MVPRSSPTASARRLVDERGDAAARRRPCHTWRGYVQGQRSRGSTKVLDFFFLVNRSVTDCTFLSAAVFFPCSNSFRCHFRRNMTSSAIHKEASWRPVVRGAGLSDRKRPKSSGRRRSKKKRSPQIKKKRVTFDRYLTVLEAESVKRRLLPPFPPQSPPSKKKNGRRTPTPHTGGELGRGRRGGWVPLFF